MSKSRRTEGQKDGSPSLNSMGFLLHRAQSRLRGAVIEAIEGSGLIGGHLAVIGALSDRGGMSQKRLSDLTQIEKSSMVIFIDTLEGGGWVRRERDPNDRRAHIVQLTPQGARRFAELSPKLLKAQQQFLQPLNSAEVSALTDMLARLGGAFDDSDSAR